MKRPKILHNIPHNGVVSHQFLSQIGFDDASIDAMVKLKKLPSIVEINDSEWGVSQQVFINMMKSLIADMMVAYEVTYEEIMKPENKVRLDWANNADKNIKELYDTAKQMEAEGKSEDEIMKVLVDKGLVIDDTNTTDEAK